MAILHYKTRAYINLKDETRKHLNHAIQLCKQVKKLLLIMQIAKLCMISKATFY